MGTNYYLQKKSGTCPTCGHCYENPRHIGKSSGGWCFSLHVYPEENIITLKDWKKLYHDADAIIVNEYGEFISANDMDAIITDRSWKKSEEPYGYASWYHFHENNHSMDGPNGLLRHRVDGRHCVGHGEGTWDYIIGEFS